MADSLPILDAHIHLWDPVRTPRPTMPLVKLLGWNAGLLRLGTRYLLPESIRSFLGRADYAVAPYLPPDYAADHGHHEVSGYIYVEAGWLGWGRLVEADETGWMETTGRLHDATGPQLRGIVAAADLRRADLGKLLRAHRAASGRLCGIRDMLAWSADRGVMNYAKHGSLMGDPDWWRGFAMLADHDLCFDAWMYLDQAEGLFELLGKNPRVRVVLDHLLTPVAVGGPFAGYGQDEAAQARIRERWREVIARLAEFPQVHAKLSGMFMPVLGWGLHQRQAGASVEQITEALRPFVEHALGCFGVERCMFASNFPMDKVSLSFETLYDAYRALVAGRPEAEQRALLHDNALRIYGIA